MLTAAKRGGWEFSYATQQLTWTDEMFRIYETTAEEFAVSRESMLARCVPESRRALEAACAAAVSAVGDSEIQLELEIATLKNQRLWVHFIGRVEKMDGKPLRAFGSVQNVQAPKLARIALENSTGWLLLVDTDLRIRFINRAARGMSFEELIGRDISVLLPASSRTTVIGKLNQVLATAQTVTYEYAAEVDGATEYFENRAVLVRDNGIGTFISITIRNITERKRLEQEILDVSSRERQTIGRDLHDGLGQELTGVALMLRGLATRIQKECPEAVDQVNEVVVLVNQSIETARALARGLLPVNTDDGGLPSALRALADRSRALYGFEVALRTAVSPAVVLSETSSSHLYRIAQEALTNAARHGQASTVRLDLRITQKRFLLQITDDGIGIGEKGGNVPGMGLKIMRYRASMIGAKFEIVPDYPHGTVVRVAGEQPMTMTTLQSAHAI